MSLHTTLLTEENLQNLDEALPWEEDAGTGTTSVSSVESLSRTFHVLGLNNIFLEKDHAKERGKDVIREATRIVKWPRHSMMDVFQSEALSKRQS